MAIITRSLPCRGEVSFHRTEKWPISHVPKVTLFDIVVLHCDCVRMSRIPLHLSTTCTSDVIVIYIITQVILVF